MINVPSHDWNVRPIRFIPKILQTAILNYSKWDFNQVQRFWMIYLKATQRSFVDIAATVYNWYHIRAIAITGELIRFEDCEIWNRILDSMSWRADQ